MSLMFAKQFSEAGVTSTTTSKKGGRGRGAGSGFGGRGKRGGRGGAPPDDASEAHLNMDASYRTHMLFPGRKDEDGGGGDGPRRSSGSPSFMKQMMSGMMGKRPSDPRASNSQELTRYRATPTRGSESEFSSLETSAWPRHGAESDPYNRGLVKSVSFHGGQRGLPPSRPNYSPTSPLSSPLSSTSLLSTSPPTNNVTTNGFIPYHEPFREHDYASYVAGGMHFETNTNPIMRCSFWIFESFYSFV